MDTHDSTGIDDEELPPDLARAIQAAFGLDDPPATLGGWLSATARALDGSGLSVGVDDLCTAEESRHVAVVGGERRQFHCVLDALLLPFLRSGEAPVAVRSRSPVSDDVVELSVSRETVEATPPDAVMSFGLADSLAVSHPGDVGPAVAYEQVCPYVNAFPSREAYDRWAGETAEAATMAMSFPTALDLAATLADRPQFGSD